MIKLSCFKYEDDEDENQNLITIYLILVEDRIKNLKYTIHKRYSDFFQLYLILRESSPEIDVFPFPNKSIFSSRSR